MIWAVVFLTLALVHFGNGCSQGFRTLEAVSTVDLASCAKGESDLATSVPAMKLGYIGSRQVVYYDQGDGWLRIEGDMLYPSNGGGLPTKPVPEGISQGVGVQGAAKWPNGRIPYSIDPNLPNQQRVVDAVNHWNTNLMGMIQFVVRTNEADYAYFQLSTTGCSSPVGYYPGAGPHPVQLANECGSGNVAHEMGHIVGLDHEQNRLDRDNYVTIDFSKITTAYVQNFSITADHKNYQTYDFGSIMHYPLTAFSNDGSATIIPKVSVPAGITVGQRQSLSTVDIASVIEMYGGRKPIDGGGTTGAVSGLFGHYYGSPDFQNLVSEQLDSNVNFDWGSGAPATGLPVDHFSIRWKGWLAPSASGSYSLIVNGQDGYRVILDDASIINNLSGTGTGSSQSQSSAINLTKGVQHRLIVEMIGRSGNASLRLSWRKDGGTEEVIPTTELVPNLISDLPTSLCTGL